MTLVTVLVVKAVVEVLVVVEVTKTMIVVLNERLWSEEMQTNLLFTLPFFPLQPGIAIEYLHARGRILLSEGFSADHQLNVTINLEQCS